MTYHQITSQERYTLGLLRHGGLFPVAIARVLGRHRSTIAREVRHNGTPRDGCYRPPLAEWYAQDGAPAPGALGGLPWRIATGSRRCCGKTGVRADRGPAARRPRARD